MDNRLYSELISNINEYVESGEFAGCVNYVFAHCEASLTIIDEMFNRGFFVEGILDNSKEKQGLTYREVPVVSPEQVLKDNHENTKVLLATRFYEQMNEQLRELGFIGQIIKLVDYNTYAEYSLSKDTLERKQARVSHGLDLLARLKGAHKGAFLVLCPFNALGDVYFCMSYLKAFLDKKSYSKYVMIVPSESCKAVAALFGAEEIEVLEQKELDSLIQAVIYSRDESCFIAHQDRPYVINLHKALYKKMIPLEEIYKVGVFGLEATVQPDKPCCWSKYAGLNEIPEGRAVILSPYAKSVTPIAGKVWDEIVADLVGKGYKVFTNVFGDEKVLEGTSPISPRLNEMKSVVERAGLFISIRSGMCDVLRTAECKKIALFPDYNYGDTKWKAIDMYALDEFENVVVGEDYRWQMN